MAEPVTNVLGTVAIKNCGEYDETIHYEKLNVVTYNGSSYCAKDNVIGVLPTNATFWALMAEKGNKGDTGYTPVKGVDYYTSADKEELEADLADDVTEEVNSQLSSLTSATPLVASSTAGMSDTSRVYVNTTDGHWYWYNGSAWTDGGIYQATELADNAVERKNIENDFFNNDIKISIPEFTLSRGYWSNAIVPELVDFSGFKYSSPIELKKGQTIRVNAYGYLTNLNIIIEVTSEGTPVLGLAKSAETGQRYYEYTAQTDMYVSISGRTSGSGDKLECYIKYDLLDNKLIKNINGLEPINQSNLLNENDSYILQSTTKSYNTIDYGLIKKEVELTINASSLSYTYLFYALKKFELGSFTKADVKNVVACIEIKGEPIDGLYFTVRGNSGRNLTQEVADGNLYLSDLDPSVYKKYYINIPYTSGKDFDSLYVGVMCSTLQTLTNAKLYIRYIGMKVNSNELDLRTNPFTVYDYKEQLEEEKEYEIETLFSSFHKFGVIGDSLASGESVAKVNGQNTYIDNYDYSWGQFIARKYGMTCVNFSKGGMTTRSWLTASEGLPRLMEPENKCNAYVIGLGVNDYTLGDSYIGTAEDIHVEDASLNADTFYGNYGKIISSVKAIQPKAKIFIFTIPDQDTNPTRDYTNLNVAIREIETIFDDVYLIDLANDYKNYYTQGFIRSNMRVGHYNSIAYNYMSDLLYKWFNDYMLINYTEFKEIEFIGTNYEYYS